MFSDSSNIQNEPDVIHEIYTNFYGLGQFFRKEFQ